MKIDRIEKSQDFYQRLFSDPIQIKNLANFICFYRIFCWDQELDIKTLVYKNLDQRFLTSMKIAIASQTNRKTAELEQECLNDLIDKMIHGNYHQWNISVIVAMHRVELEQLHFRKNIMLEIKITMNKFYREYAESKIISNRNNEQRRKKLSLSDKREYSPGDPIEKNFELMNLGKDLPQNFNKSILSQYRLLFLFFILTGIFTLEILDDDEEIIFAALLVMIYNTIDYFLSGYIFKSALILPAEFENGLIQDLREEKQNIVEKLYRQIRHTSHYESKTMASLPVLVSAQSKPAIEITEESNPKLLPKIKAKSSSPQLSFSLPTLESAYTWNTTAKGLLAYQPGRTHNNLFRLWQGKQNLNIVIYFDIKALENQGYSDKTIQFFLTLVTIAHYVGPVNEAGIEFVTKSEAQSFGLSSRTTAKVKNFKKEYRQLRLFCEKAELKEPSTHRLTLWTTTKLLNTK